MPSYEPYFPWVRFSGYDAGSTNAYKINEFFAVDDSLGGRQVNAAPGASSPLVLTLPEHVFISQGHGATRLGRFPGNAGWNVFEVRSGHDNGVPEMAFLHSLADNAAHPLFPPETGWPDGVEIAIDYGIRRETSAKHVVEIAGNPNASANGVYDVTIAHDKQGPLTHFIYRRDNPMPEHDWEISYGYVHVGTMSYVRAWRLLYPAAGFDSVPLLSITGETYPLQCVAYALAANDTWLRLPPDHVVWRDPETNDELASMTLTIDFMDPPHEDLDMEADRRYMSLTRLDDGRIVRDMKDFTVERDAASAGNRPVMTDDRDMIDPSRIPVADLNLAPGGEIVIPASENLSEGDLVNFHYVGGEWQARRADAGALDKPARGFVTDNVTAGNNATVRASGECPQVVAAGSNQELYLSDTPGKATGNTDDIDDGYVLLQRVGVRTGSATSFDYRQFAELIYNMPV